MKIQPVTPCSALLSMSSSPESYRNAASFDQSAAKTAARAMRALDDALAADVRTHFANLQAMESNQAIRAHVTELMRGIGIPDSWSDRVRAPRSFRMKFVTVHAGYAQDLAKHCPVADGFAEAVQAYARLKRDYEAYAERARIEAIKQDESAKRAAEADAAKRKEDLALAAIILRYGLDEGATWEDALESLLKKEPLLELAVAMMDVRMDFSTGPRPVFAVLNSIETKTDRSDIIASVRATAEDWDGDGRIFRDCEWSYDRILSTVADRQLVIDAQRARTHCAR